MARSNALPLRGVGSGAEAARSMLPPASMARRVAWVVLAAAWVFGVLALISFSSTDWPSHVVAVHADPPHNFGGHLGAALSYGLYRAVGLGTWIIVLAVGGWLALAATGRTVGHPVIRLLGVGLAAVSLSGLQATWLGGMGSLTGIDSGVMGMVLANELAARFGTVVVTLVLLTGLTVGAVIAADELVLAGARRVPAALRWTAGAIATTVRWLDPRPAVASVREWLATRSERRHARVAERLAAESALARRRRRPRGRVDGPIDPDMGGVGATDSFDPDDGASLVPVDDDLEEVEDEDVEYEDEEVEYEDDEVDDDPELVDEADADEWEYEYVDEDDDAELEDEEEEEEEEEDEDDEYEVLDEDEDDAASEEEEEQERRLSTDELKAKIARLPLRMTGGSRAVARDEDIPRTESFEGYRFPSLDLLEDPEGNYSEKMESFVREQAATLEQSLQTFSIDAEVTGIESGPVVTLFAVQLAPGTRVARLQAISSDIARSLQAQNIRIISNMAGKTTVGIEVPNLHKEKVRLKELMSGGSASKMGLPMFLGKDAAGEPLVADLTRMPHMLIAGTTGSGKSVCMNSIIMSWLYTKRPDELKLVLVDPKMVEMSQFSEIPHLMCPVVTEMGRAAAILEWAVAKMEERYELLREARVRDLASYNDLTEEELLERFEPQNEVEEAKIPRRLPYMVFVIDELADLMMTNKEVEHSIVRIAQKARAVGIHLILATQRPQANVVTGLIKSNMPCRASFKVASGMDSRIVLDAKGAELLLGQGDMLLLSPQSSDLSRAQGTLVTDREIRKVVKFLKDVATPTFERSLVSLRASSDDEGGGLDEAERDPLFDKGVEIMIETGRGSVSLLQRRLAIGYSRASRLVDQMGLAGILGDHKGSVAREVMITMEDWTRMKAMEAGEESSELQESSESAE